MAVIALLVFLPMELSPSHIDEVMGPPFSAADEPDAPSIWVHENVTLVIIEEPFEWRAIAHTWDGQAVYHENLVLMHVAREYEPDFVMAYSGYIVYYDMWTDMYGTYRAVHNPYSSHTGGDIAIDGDGILWLVCGGYSHQVPIRLYRSNESLNLFNWTHVATVSTTYGATAPSVIVNDTLVTVFWRDGPNDASSTKIRMKTYWKSNFTLKRDKNIAVGGHNTWTLTNSYTATTYEPQTDEHFLSWSYKRTIPSELWGSMPFIKVVGMGEDFVASDGISYRLKDDGDGLIEFKEADIPQNGVLVERFDGAAAHIQIGRTPSGTLYFAKILNVESDSSRVTNHSLCISYSQNKTWIGNDVIGHNKGIGVENCVVDTQNYFGALYAQNNKIYLTWKKNNQWQPPLCIVHDIHNITGISVAAPATAQDIDDSVRFFYSTTPQQISEPNRRGFYNMDNNIRFGFFNMQLLASRNTPPLCTLSAAPESGYAPLTVSFFMSASDEDSIVSWSLDVDDDGLAEYGGQGSPPAVRLHTYQHPGEYTARLTVTDTQTAAEDITATVMVYADIRTPHCELSVAPESGYAPLTVSFFMSASDEDSIVSWSLDVDDDGLAEYGGQGSPPAVQNHTFGAPGLYTAVLHVSWHSETVVSRSQEIVVGQSIDPKPEIDIIYPQAGDVVNGVVRIEWAVKNVSSPLVDISILYSDTNGTIWRPLAQNILDGQTTYLWDTTSLGDGTHYLLKVVATDEEGCISSGVSAGPFVIYNNLLKAWLTFPTPGCLIIYDKVIMPLLTPTIVVGSMRVAVSTMCGLPVDTVEFYLNGVLKFNDTQPPYQWLCNEWSFGRCSVEIVARDCQGTRVADMADVWFFNMPRFEH